MSSENRISSMLKPAGPVLGPLDRLGPCGSKRSIAIGTRAPHRGGREQIRHRRRGERGEDPEDRDYDQRLDDREAAAHGAHQPLSTLLTRRCRTPVCVSVSVPSFAWPDPDTGAPVMV